MKPIDYLVTLVGLVYLASFVGGIIYTNPIVYELYADKVWKILGKRFFKFILCFAFVIWRVWG